jgi:hypothetical protein
MQYLDTTSDVIIVTFVLLILAIVIGVGVGVARRHIKSLYKLGNKRSVSEQ